MRARYRAWGVVFCAPCECLFALVCFFFVLGRVLDRVRVFGVGDLPVELRGWSREVGEVDFECLPTVSEAFSPCPIHRDVYVRRVLNLQPRVNDSLSIGKALHELFLAPLRLVNRVGAGDLSSLKAQLLSGLPRDLVGFGVFLPRRIE